MGMLSTGLAISVGLAFFLKKKKWYELYSNNVIGNISRDNNHFDSGKFYNSIMVSTIISVNDHFVIALEEMIWEPLLFIALTLIALVLFLRNDD